MRSFNLCIYLYVFIQKVVLFPGFSYASLNMEHQFRLLEAIGNKKFDCFCEHLSMGNDPSKAVFFKNNYVSAFELSLATRDSAEFVEECLKWGCNPYNINHTTGKPAIHFAVESLDPRNLSILLQYRGIDINRKYAGQTPLNSLLQHVENFEVDINDIVYCTTMLLEYGAAPNMPDREGVPPIVQVLNSNISETKKAHFIKIFLQQDAINLDSYCDGKARAMLMQKYPDVQLPATQPNTNTEPLSFKDVYEIFTSTRYYPNFEAKTMKALQHFLLQPTPQTVSEEEKYLNTVMINVSIEVQLNMLFNALQQVDFLINGSGYLDSPIKTAMLQDNLYALKQLLLYKNISSTVINELLIQVCYCRIQSWEFIKSREKVLEALLASEKFDVNYFDSDGYSLLYYADVRMNFDNSEEMSIKATSKLLEKGAYIGAINQTGERALQNLSSELLEQHFDTCIASNQLSAGDRDFKIVIDYKNLLCPASTDKEEECSLNKKLQQEIDAIAFIAESPKYKRLLLHPLLSSFILLKWRRISTLFYLNFLSFFVFSLSMFLHTLFVFGANDHVALTRIFAVLSWLSLLMLIFREIFQALVAPENYLLSMSNFVEMLLVGFSLGTLISENANAAAITILLVSWELSLLIASLPVLFISTLMLMWKTVLTTFSKCLVVFFVFLLNFSLCFFILFGRTVPSNESHASAPEETPASTNESSIVIQDEGDDDFNKFMSPIATIAKTLVMLTGEFDASDLQLHSLTSYLVFLLFVFLMTIVLFNLLNGLAVSDTQAIKSQAELSGLMNRVKLLQRYIEIINNKIFERKYFKKTLRALLHFNQDYSLCNQIAILPNQANKVEIVHRKRIKNQSTENAQTPEILPFWPHILLPAEHEERVLLLHLRKHFLDSETIKLALTVIERNAADVSKRKRVQELEERQRRFEQGLEKKLKEQKSDTNKQYERLNAIEVKQAYVEDQLSEIARKLCQLETEQNRNNEMLKEILSLCENFREDRN